jgi:hypothetical protein|tara:strand:+ start:2587 stop:2976 length:390 start_codon:yes stop_codon:yes gene_type:complete
MQQLDDSNFLLYAAANYDNPHCYDTDEFQDDLKRFKYLKRLFNKYRETGELKERLIFNHLTVIYNVFGPVVGTRMLFFKLQEHYDLLKPFLTFMNHMPDIVYNIGSENKNIKSVDLSMDQSIIDVLRKL